MPDLPPSEPNIKSSTTGNPISTASKARRAFTRHILPWGITLAAVYYVGQDISGADLLNCVKKAHLGLLLLALVITIACYFVRARRWQTLFPNQALTYAMSLKVLIFGFLMNNLLPARAGEFVRAHLGAKVTGSTKTLVLATIASERLADGLTLSIFFFIFGVGLGGDQYSNNFALVAYAFAIASTAVVMVLLFRHQCFRLLSHLKERTKSSSRKYLFSRMTLFLKGFEPLTQPRALAIVFFWSLLIWGGELMVFYTIATAYHAALPLAVTVLFMVAVNFSSLIPSAPGAIGVIEAVATAVLVACGVERELALTMVLTQHALQFLVTGVGGGVAGNLLRQTRKERVVT